jgi:RNA polymerase sigma-70 factor (ECF subfamily)
LDFGNLVGITFKVAGDVCDVEDAKVQQVRQETLQAYREYAEALERHARRLTRDSALAQDAVQETFLRFFLSRMQGEEIRHPSAWLHRVAHNYICETARSAAVRAVVALDAEAEAALSTEPENFVGEWGEAARRVLAPREWECVQLRVEGFDYTEIAAEMAIRPGTVGTLLHRAAEKLRMSFRRRKGEQ